MVVSGSADKTVKAFDVGQQREVMSGKSTDSIFCGQVVKDRIFVTGCGDGNLIAYDLGKNMECLWGYGVDEVGAVHCLQVSPDNKFVVAGGDSGAPIKVMMSGF